VTERNEIRRPDDVAGFLADPEWLPHRVLDEGRLLQLVRLPRSEQRALSFVDKRKLSEDAPRVEVPVASVLELVGTAKAGSCHFIFHSAFCCSTLVSRALDIDGVASVLKEPEAFNDLVRMMRQASLPYGPNLTLKLVLDLMQRPRLPKEKTIIKPTNMANPLIEPIMQAAPDSHALLMYASLPAFLLAIARGKRWSWARNLAAFYRDHLEFETPETRDLLYLTDFQIAAFLWLQHQAQFARLVRELPSGRVATLRADVFLEQPVQALAAAGKLFEIGLTDGEAAAIVASPLFQSHSKRPNEAFDESVRKRDDVLVKLAYGAEIERAAEWGEGIAEKASIPLELEAPLISAS